MKTKIVQIDPFHPQEEYLKDAAEVLAKGGLVIIPTETVYGIAANMLNKETIKRLYEIKRRPLEKLFSLHISDKARVENFAKDIPVSAYKLMDKFWPGPLTLILQAFREGTVGLRMPDNEIALRIIAYSKVPVVCPSANLSGKAAPVDFKNTIRDLDGLVDLAIDAGTTRLQAESSVVDLTIEPLKVLREGAISKQEIASVTGKKHILFVCTGNSCRSVMAEGLLKKKMKEKNRSDIEVSSAGIMMLSGLGASAETRELLKREGVDASGHLSRRVTLDMLRRSDLILVMERLHEEKILSIAPDVKNRVFLLKEFAKIEDDNLNLADPIGGTAEFYAQTFSVIKEAIERVSEII